ncbi:MAG: DUF4864 domain-containing protein [Waddliaceae bacterium]
MMGKTIAYLVGLVIVGLILALWLTSTRGSMVNVVKGQLQKFREHKLTQAYYDYTAQDFQETTSLDAFREFISSYPVLSENKALIIERKKVDNHDIGTIKGIVISNDLHEMNIEYRLTKENNKWKILSLELREFQKNGNRGESATVELIEKIDGQLKALRKNRVVDAYYGYASKDFQKKTPLQAFQDYVKDHPILLNYQGINFKDRRIENNRGYVNLLLNSKEGPYRLEYQLTREGGEWKIWSLRILLPPEEAAKKASTNPRALVLPVREILDALLLKNIKKSYEGTAKEFQDATNFEDFQEFVEHYPVLTQRDLADIKSGLIENGVGKLRVNLHNEKGMTVVEFHLGFEEGQWKIWKMEMLEYPEEQSGKEAAQINGRDSVTLIEKLFTTVQDQLNALRHQDIFATYFRFASTRYKNEHSLQQLESFLTKFPAFTENLSSEFTHPFHLNNRATLRGKLTTFDHRQYPVKYEMIYEDGSWKIDDFAVIPEKELVATSEQSRGIHIQIQELDLSNAKAPARKF